AEGLGPVLLLGGDAHADRAPALLDRLPVLLRHLLVLVEDGQAHHVPAHLDRTEPLHLEAPPRSDPRPRAQGVEPEVHRGRSVVGHVASLFRNPRNGMSMATTGARSSRFPYA